MTELEKLIALTEEEEAAIMTAERQVQELDPILQKLDECGADCQERRNRIAHLLSIAATMRKNFGRIPEAE